MNTFYKVLVWVFGSLSATTAGCVGLLFLVDAGARKLGEDFGLTPWWLYAVLGAGVCVLAFASWFCWMREGEDCLPPNHYKPGRRLDPPPEPEIEAEIPLTAVWLTADCEEFLRNNNPVA